MYKVSLSKSPRLLSLSMLCFLIPCTTKEQYILATDSFFLKDDSVALDDSMEQLDRADFLHEHPKIKQFTAISRMSYLFLCSLKD